MFYSKKKAKTKKKHQLFTTHPSARGLDDPPKSLFTIHSSAVWTTKHRAVILKRKHRGKSTAVLQYDPTKHPRGRNTEWERQKEDILRLYNNTTNNAMTQYVDINREGRESDIKQLNNRRHYCGTNHISLPFPVAAADAGSSKESSLLFLHYCLFHSTSWPNPQSPPNTQG